MNVTPRTPARRTESHRAHHSRFRAANRSLVARLLLFTAGSFAFGFALVPLYDVLCKVAGIGNAEAKAGRATAHEAVDVDRVVTLEFLTNPASVGTYEFRPTVASMKVHPGKLYDTQFFAHNLTRSASVAQAVPGISPGGAAQYFHKTECFCFSPQKFAPGESRNLIVRFIIDPQLPSNVDKLTLQYTLFDKT